MIDVMMLSRPRCGMPSTISSTPWAADRTLDRIVRIVAAEGGTPGDIVKITTFVTNITEWRDNTAAQDYLFAEYFQGPGQGL